MEGATPTPGEPIGAPAIGVTSDVGETEALGLARAGGVGVEEDPDMVPGRDEGRRDGRAAEPEGLLAGRGRGAQHEPVQGALVGLLHVKVAEAAGGREDRRREWVAREQQVMLKLTRTASPSIPSLLHSQPLSRPPGVQEWLREASGQCGQLGTCQPPCSSVKASSVPLHPPPEHTWCPNPRPHAGGGRSPMVGTSLHLHSPLKDKVQGPDPPTLALLQQTRHESQARALRGPVRTGQAWAGGQLIPWGEALAQAVDEQGQGVL